MIGRSSSPRQQALREAFSQESAEENVEAVETVLGREPVPEQFLKELRLCDSPKKVQPNDYFAKISGNFGVKIIGNLLVRDRKEAVYTVYVLQVRHDQYDLASKTWNIFRRYRQFYALNECLRVKNYKLPSFPPKKMLGTFDHDFVAKRQKQLSKYLEELLSLPPLKSGSTPLNPRHAHT